MNYFQNVFKIYSKKIIKGPSCPVVVFLIERKNKERYLATHNILRGPKALELGDEFSFYDKVLKD